jgi:hypothetical protein
VINPALTGAPLLEAARSLLRDEVLPALPEGQRHAALMIANALAVATRAVRQGDSAEREELERLAVLLGLPPDEQGARSATAGNRLLCDRIRAGHADEGRWRAEVLAHLQASCRRQLEVSNPKALADGAGRRRATT